jgi:hypothetical protein
MVNATTQAAPRVRVLRIQRGINDQITGFREEAVDYNQPLALDYDPLIEMTRRENSPFQMSLIEALVSKPDAANMLRDGIRFMAFEQMRQMPRTWSLLARTETSGRKEEEYLRDAGFGVIPVVPSGSPVPFIEGSFDGGTKITNHLHRMGVQVTGDDIKFDRTGKVRQIASGLGRSAVVTEESDFYAAITTTANYTRNSTTGDNDTGANQVTTTFNALGLDAALTTVSTSKDRKSGQYLGYKADTIWTTPKMEFPVKQMLMSERIVRSNSAAAEVRGTGEYNPYMGLLDKIVISPWVGTSYQWGVCDSTVYSFVVQTVEPWQVLQEGMVETSEAWLINNAIRYIISGYYGMGFVDDRAWFFSDSTTAPTVS